MPEFDRSKNYMYMQDNEDGTVTMEMNFAMVDIHDIIVIDLKFEDLMTAMAFAAQALPTEVIADMHGHMTLVPNSPEDNA